MERLLADVEFPRVARARQKFPVRAAVDVEEDLARELSQPEIVSRLGDARSVAVAIGSRGVADIDRIARAVVKHLQGLGREPFIVPAMGSHGGATAEGQVDVLAHLGITEATVGAPVRSSMEVVQLGTSASGIPVYMDKLAHAADATVVVNRTKPHTGFRGPIESGLMKILSIGLGKHKGAAAIHAEGMGTFESLIPEIGNYVLDHANIAYGVAVVESAREEPIRLVAIEADRIEQVEKDLLAEARGLMARILLPRLDVLVVQEMGKNISGDGMDPNVTGRYTGDLPSTGPDIQKIVVLDLTEETYGNAIGVGQADVATRRLVDGIDHFAMYVNAMTARVLSPVKVPLTVDTDRDAIAVALASCWGVEPGRQRMMIIQSTLKLEDVYISESAMEDVQDMADVEALGEPFELSFDRHGSIQLPSGLAEASNNGAARATSAATSSESVESGALLSGGQD